MAWIIIIKLEEVNGKKIIFFYQKISKIVNYLKNLFIKGKKNGAIRNYTKRIKPSSDAQ